jgi:membrane protein implicated in regulation of membrane protease activity
MNLIFIWIAFGILCLILEIFTPGFIFFSIGAGAIIAGVFASIGGAIVQVLVFVLATALAFFFMKKFSKFFLKKDNNIKSNIFALENQVGIVIKEILPDEKGYVKIEGEEWSAISLNNEHIEIGSHIKVIKIQGNKLIVSQITHKGE